MKTNSRRQWLKQVGAAGLLGSVGLSSLIREALASGSKPILSGVHKLTGNVSINGKPASVGMVVGSGDTIVTGPGSEAIYVINQDAFLQRESSSVSFSGLTADFCKSEALKPLVEDPISTPGFDCCNWA